MAEKEERISVIVYEKDPCKNCPGNPMTDCQVCEKDLRYDGGMTRQDAIERMAKAMCIRDNGISCDECIYKNSNNCKTTLENWFIEDAEAALNAIAPMIPQEEQNER